MKHFITILMVLLLTQESKPCICNKIVSRDSSVNYGLRHYEIVFYGELIKTDTKEGTFQFKILELFKGEYRKDTINGCASTTCSILPWIDGLWIVYAEYNEDSTINLSVCSPSIPLKKVEGLMIPPPEPSLIDYKIKDKTITDLETKIYFLEKKTEGISYWLYDLEKLREFKKAHLKIENKKDKKNILILSLIALNIVLIFMILMKRKK